jgi:glycosyltransferase involved in cell wall biosynthesis
VTVSAVTVPVTLVVPAFNEARRIGPFLDELRDWVGANPGTELIVVDDGSTDDTAAVVGRHLRTIPGSRLLTLTTNGGKGVAVRLGLAEANGCYRLFLDADGSTSADQVPALVEAAAGRDDIVVIGSTAMPGAVIEGDQGALRRLAGRLSNRLALSQDAGYEICEVPIRWHHVEGSKVHLHSYVQTLRDVMRIWRRRRQGLGRPPTSPGDRAVRPPARR